MSIVGTSVEFAMVRLTAAADVVAARARLPVGVIVAGEMCECRVEP